VVGGLVLLAASAAGASAATAGQSTAGATTPTVGAKPTLEVCGQGHAVTRPSSVILTCADDGELAEHLTWTSWGATRATASGIVTWRTGARDLAGSTRWDRTRANIVLTNPVTKPGHRTLFTQLELHVTGATPKGFLRDLRFNEAPATVPVSSVPESRASSAKVRPAVSPIDAAASGTLGYGDIEGFWLDAGGPNGSSGGYTDAQIAAAITGAESSFLPGNIQQGVDYCDAAPDEAGWGLWQITCGNSVPAYGTDFQLLDPWNNAEAAVSKCAADVAAGDNCFAPWTTYATGKYESYLQSTAPVTGLTDPGQYVQYSSTPPGTPASPAANPGSTYGPTLGSTPSPVSDDSAGNFTAFVNSSGQLAYDSFASSWSGPTVLPGTPRADSPVVVAPGGGYVFFIESNGDIANDWYTSTGWSGPGLTGGTAEPGSALAYSPGSTTDGSDPAIAFQNASGAIVNDYATSTGWAGPAPIPGAALTGTPIAWNTTGTNIYYVNASGNVTNAYWSASSGWQGPGDTGGTAERGTSLTYSPGSTTDDTDPSVAFQNASGTIVNDYYNTSGWNGPAPLPGAATPGTPLAYNATGTNIYYVNASGNATNDYFSASSGWAGPGDTGGAALAGSPLVYSPGSTTDDTDPSVFFINTSGTIVNDYYNTSGWNGPAPLPGTPR
jgi:hypothetical protein